MPELEAPPRSGAGSGKDNWIEFAEANDVELSPDDTKDEIIAKVEAAGLIGPEDGGDGDGTSPTMVDDGTAVGVTRGPLPHHAPATDEMRAAAQPEDDPRRIVTPAASGMATADPDDTETVTLDEDLIETFVAPRSKRPSHRLVAPKGRTVKASIVSKVKENNAKVEEYLASLD